MDKYQFILDGVIVPNPDEWREMELTTERDKDISGILTLFTSELTFKGAGYRLLKQRFDVTYNSFIDAVINRLNGSAYAAIVEGIMLLSDIKFNLDKKTATVRVQDGSFQGGIDNHKNVKAFLDSGFSINDVQITSPAFVELDFFIPSTGVYPAGFNNRNCYLVIDTLDFLVRFMTDNRVKGVASPYLRTKANFEGGLLYVVSGEEIRTGAADAPNVKFADIMQFLKRTHNLTFGFDTNPDGDPRMIVENRELFFGNDVTATIRKIKDLTLEVDTERLFSHLLVGNNTFVEPGNCSPTIRFFAFRDEDYVIQGKANIDKALDLRTDYITDSNTIEDIIVNDEDSFDEDIFVVTSQPEATGLLAGKFQDVNYCSNLFFYNKGLTNDQIILRQVNSIPGNVAKALVSATTPSRTSIEHEVFLISPNVGVLTFPHSFDAFPFDLEVSPNYDIGSNYDSAPGKHQYEVPFAATYGFDYDMVLNITPNGGFPNFGVFVDITFTIQRLTSTNNLTVEEEIEKKITFYKDAPSNNFLDQDGNLFLANDPAFNYTVSDAVNLTCAIGNLIRLKVRTEIQFGFTFIQIFVLPNASVSFFRCLGADEDAGTYTVFKPDDYRVLLYKFAKNQSRTQSTNLFLNRTDQIKINEGSNPNFDKATWIQSVSHKLETGETQFTLIN